MTIRLSRWSGLVLLVGAALVVSLLPTQAQDKPNLNEEINKRIKEWETPSNPLNKFAWTPPGVADPGTLPQSTGKGISLHVGLNKVSATAYPGTPDLAACENDAIEMEKLARAGGFQTKLLTSAPGERQGTAARVKAEIEAASKVLKAGDTFLFTYSGHGGYRVDKTGQGDEPVDQTLCLFERQLIDDELAELWVKFEPGVRIVMVADSCHSGTVYKFKQVADEMKRMRGAFRGAGEPEGARMLRQAEAVAAGEQIVGDTATFRALTTPQQNEADKNQKELDEVKKNTPPAAKSLIKMRASLVHFGACQDHQLAGERGRHGLFTAAILQSVARSDVTSYESLFKSTERILASEPNQQPKFNKDGPGAEELAKVRPFRP